MQTNMKTIIDELNATTIRVGRKWVITHIDGEPLTEPKTYASRREMLSELKDWWENGWQANSR